ncbi:MAG TPA: hypothetical protein VJ124_15415 [Pyrinomonadaceae bacterium]|nr:hypothetical protein [Pyrinomonadaceae bacterium]
MKPETHSQQTDKALERRVLLWRVLMDPHLRFVSATALNISRFIPAINSAASFGRRS